MSLLLHVSVPPPPLAEPLTFPMLRTCTMTCSKSTRLQTLLCIPANNSLFERNTVSRLPSSRSLPRPCISVSGISIGTYMTLTALCISLSDVSPVGLLVCSTPYME
ncbi:hypothetical protein P692DRAFT_20353875 [Suillus brevipes Sb2]|nr:hypothetical protein P692DRAFT_20353875 [Suillus brevipes Sb2]